MKTPDAARISRRRPGVAQPPRETRAEHGAHQEARDDQALQERGEGDVVLDEEHGAGDDPGVIAPQDAAQGPEDPDQRVLDACGHGAQPFCGAIWILRPVPARNRATASSNSSRP